VNPHHSDANNEPTDEEFRVDLDPLIIGGRADRSGTIKAFKASLNRLIRRRHLNNPAVDEHNRAAAEARWGKKRDGRRQDSEGHP
jgi:hypothetical protein